jgi:hypothetical protein
MRLAEAHLFSDQRGEDTASPVGGGGIGRSAPVSARQVGHTSPGPSLLRKVCQPMAAAAALARAPV